MKGMSNLNNSKLNIKEFCTNPFIWRSGIYWKYGGERGMGDTDTAKHVMIKAASYICKDSGPVWLGTTACCHSII